jgi:peptidoglycan/xylan/chitin deacetylase (PgdA/CDA1 family)
MGFIKAPLLVIFSLLFLSACTQSKPVDTQVKSPSVQSSTQTEPLLPPKEKQKNNGEKQKLKVPVFMYHSISNKPGNNLCVPPELFEKQLQEILDLGFTPITASEYYQAMANHAPLPKNPILLTFDDGYADNYTQLFPILKKYNVKGIVFPITGLVNENPNFLSTTQMKEMEQSGLVEFGSHTKNHTYLATVDLKKVNYELVESKRFLEESLGKPIRIFCYPYGDYSPAVIEEVKKIGYLIAFTIEEGGATFFNQEYSLDRHYITPHTSLSFLKEYIS